MKFSVTIDSRDSALHGAKARAEVAQMLRDMAVGVEAGSEGCGLYDRNGNKCGSYECDEERPEFETCEAEDLFGLADDFGAVLDDDPRKLTRDELIEGLESIGVACYDHESNDLLAAAYGDSMLAGDLPGDCDSWRDNCREVWEQ